MAEAAPVEVRARGAKRTEKVTGARTGPEKIGRLGWNRKNGEASASRKRSGREEKWESQEGPRRVERTGKPALAVKDLERGRETKKPASAAALLLS